MPSGYAFNPNVTGPFWRQLIPYFDTFENAQAFASNPIAGNLKGYKGPVPGAKGNVFDYLGQLLDESNAGATKFSPPQWRNYNLAPITTTPTSPNPVTPDAPAPITPIAPPTRIGAPRFQPETDYNPFPNYYGGNSRFRTQLR